MSPVIAVARSRLRKLTDLWPGLGPNRSISQAFRAMEAGAYSNALPSLSELVTRNDKDPEVYFLRASAYQLNAQPDKALADLSTAIRSNPEYVDAWQGLGNLHLWANRFEKAIGDYEQVVQLQPKDAAACDHTRLGARYLSGIAPIPAAPSNWPPVPAACGMEERFLHRYLGRRLRLCRQLSRADGIGD